MGFIEAFKGSLGGMLADQWIDFLGVPNNLAPTAALFPAVPHGTNNGRGANTKGSINVITNGSKIVVPEGYGLITLEDGGITGFISDPGGYIYSSDSQESKSVFTGGGVLNSTLLTSWERFKRGGQPGTEQIALFVNLKEIPNNKFGTQSEIYWDDAYMNAQVGAVARGSYTLKIVDPLLFVKNFVPATYLTGNADVFDFEDFDNPVSDQLFQEVVASLAPAFSKYTNDPDKGNRITKIQSDSISLAQSLSEAVEEAYNWRTDRGLTIVKVAIASIEYDEDTRKLLSDVKKADALSGNRSQSFLNQSVARGVEAAGENGGSGMMMFGAGAGAVGGLVGQSQQANAPVAPPAPQAQSQPVVAGESDAFAKLRQMKGLLDDGLITQEDYDAAKRKALGL